jgi:hypothetical protein
VFRWRSLELLQNSRHALRVKETVYKCKLRPWAKTEESKAYVPLPKRLAAELLEWRSLTTWAGDQDFIFPNSQGGFMDYENARGVNIATSAANDQPDTPNDAFSGPVRGA